MLAAGKAASVSRYDDYQEYLRSEHWQSLRAASDELHGKKCIRCHKQGPLEHHHLYYGGDEGWQSCTAWHVVPVCPSCHRWLHDVLAEEIDLLNIGMSGSRRLTRFMEFVFGGESAKAAREKVIKVRQGSQGNRGGIMRHQPSRHGSGKWY